MRVYRLDHLDVTLSEILACHFHGSPLQHHVLERYRSALAEANALLIPRAGVELITNYMFNDLMLSLKENAPGAYNQLRRFHESAVAVYIIFCTMGNRLDKAIQKEHTRNEVAQAFILDAVGSIGVVKLSRFIEFLVQKETADQGLRCSAPIMPGTRGIDLMLNRIIFDMVDTGRIGITLTKQFIMKPAKTLSMMIGVGPQVDAGSVAHHCDGCERTPACTMKYVWDLMDESGGWQPIIKELQATASSEE